MRLSETNADYLQRSMNRKIINFLLVGFILFVLYNTLIPFHFQTGGKPFGELLKSFEWDFFQHHGKRTPLTDIAGNLLLFIPFGFLFFTWLWQRGIRGGVVLATISGFLLSAFIEVMQLFLISRNSSVTDVFNNTAGAFLGAFAAFLYAHTIADWVNRQFRYLIKEQPLTLILIIFFLFQAFAAILPFNVSITVSDLKKTLKNINLIPFEHRSVGSLFFHRPSGFDAQPFDWFAFWENSLFWMVWGYLSALCYTLYWRVKKSGGLLWLAVLVLPPIIIEASQVFIVSRFADVNDIISTWTGMLAGMAVYLIIQPRHTYRGRKSWHAVSPAVLIYFLFILFAGLRPFDFIFSAGGPVQHLDYRAFVPFFSYFKKTSIWNIYDLINSLVYFVPISLYLSYRWREKGRSWATIYPANILFALATGILIESMQAFSPTRVAEITDALLYGIGGFLGTFIHYYIEQVLLPTLDFQGISMKSKASRKE